MIEHKMRILNHENTPCVPSITIPNFPLKKDAISTNILAYLKEYSPLVNNEKQILLPKSV